MKFRKIGNENYIGEINCQIILESNITLIQIHIYYHGKGDKYHEKTLKFMPLNVIFVNIVMIMNMSGATSKY